MKDITRKSLLINLIQTIGLILFINFSTQLFGAQEALTSVAAVTAILMFIYIPLPTSGLDGTLLTSIGFFTCGTLASLNLVLPVLIMLPINIISILALMLLFGRPFQYKFYMPFILVYIFSSTTEVANFKLSTRLLYLSVASVIIAIIYFARYFKQKNEQHLLRLNNCSQELRHASLVISLGVSIALLAIDFFDITKGMWICMTIMSLTQIESHHTKTRFKHRIIGSLMGTMIYLIIFSWLVPSQFHIIVVLLAAYIYSFIDDYIIQMIFITMNVLYAAGEIFSFNEAFITRISFILLGSILVAVLTYSLHYLQEIVTKKRA
ncbi:hypothetical protein G7081_06700 [Vagococcus coleopterorum]|uniref:Integral membrane bound transporter domain-containing protein n=1 Tax=Vagococcus coleopterorum TaxID=2714946 RepID=A0A6G8APB9_9ENTE|nr:FUSC family protein [Vagococcus coleopterorum]QIL46775.1 hypothetical protein G7081_06700 [Vagococcus coleopterorum]